MAARRRAHVRGSRRGKGADAAEDEGRMDSSARVLPATWACRPCGAPRTVFPENCQTPRSWVARPPPSPPPHAPVGCRGVAIVLVRWAARHGPCNATVSSALSEVRWQARLRGVRPAIECNEDDKMRS